jgi:enediyne biosynthesis protein E4
MPRPMCNTVRHATPCDPPPRAPIHRALWRGLAKARRADTMQRAQAGVQRATSHVARRLSSVGAIVAACIVLTGIRAPFAAAPLFLEVAADVGLKFTHVNGGTGRYYMPEQMGPGAALFDYDNDGDLDVFLVQGASLEPTPGNATTGAPTSRLFRNDLTVDSQGRRQLRFTDVTAESGLGLHAYGMGAAAADYDGDGYVDLLVTTFGPDRLYRNTGKGTFVDVTATAGVSDNLWSTSAAFLDYDRDGYLDLFVANYLDFSVTGNKACQDSVGARDYCSPRSYRPVPDRLYRNLGNGKFADVTESAGISKADGAGLGVVSGDYNADGWLDVYVANDANANQLWINKHDGTFKDEGMISGAAVNAAGNPEGSMGIASGDFDQDGDEDIFITNIVGETFVLYENDGRGNFEDVRNKVNLAAPTAAFTGFGTDWFDYDNDGWLDLFVANGAVNIVEAQRGQPTPFRMKNQLFRNDGKGRFEETSAIAGPAFARAEISRAAAFGDIDNDGDIDILVTNNGGPVRLLINQARGAASGQKPDTHFLQIALEQPGPNRRAFGAWVGVERSGRPTLWRRVRTDGSYLSANDSRLHFGLATASAIDAVVVQWPDGQKERWKGLAADRLVTLKRGTGTP